MRKLKKLFQEWDTIKDNLKWLYRQSKGIKRYVLGFLLISFVSMAFSLASPVASKYVVDAAVGADSEFQFKYVLLMLGTTVFSIILGIVSNVFSSYVNEKFAFSVRARMFDRTQRGNWADITAFHSGDMLARLTDDVNVIASNIISILPNLIVTLLQLAIVLVILLTTDPMLALIGIIVGPIGAILSLLFREPFQRYQNDLRQSQSEYYTFFQESLGNLGVVKAFQLEDHNNSHFDEIRARRLKTVLKSSKLNSCMSAIIRLVYSIGYVIAFSWCAIQLKTNPLYTYGTMTMFLSLVSRIQSSISGLGGIIPKFYSTLVCAKRVREITEQTPEKYEKEGAISQKVGLRVQDVSFSYEDEDILTHLNLEIHPCERVGIVGSSGAGKTTLIRLLLALVSPDEGELFFTDESGESEAVSAATRRLISYVPQGNTLMTGTIRENLLLGDPDADEEAMWRALESADAAQFVRNDPRGLDLPIKERSSGLSAGQAQRIGIARALMRDRPVLILDEATSALDEATERRIFETLSEQCEKTCFIITHRSSMLKYCTSVIRIDDNGKVTYSRE